MNNKWVVSIKGRPSAVYEISVVRENNRHGLSSYGWFDDSKKLISQARSYERGVPTRFVWARLKRLAKDTADHMNRQERIKHNG